MLTYGNGGLLTLRVENTLALQQASRSRTGSNSTETLNGGWPAYEFSDGSATFSGNSAEAERGAGDPAVVAERRGYAESLTVEFQDEFNEYQQDSLSLVDVDDALLTSREVTAAFPALGLPNFDQATRMLHLQLNKAIQRVHARSIRDYGARDRAGAGGLITVTYLKEGLERQPFRVVKLAPGQNYQTVQVTAQWHDDAWYTTGGQRGGRKRRIGRAGRIAAAAGGKCARCERDRSVWNHRNADRNGGRRRVGGSRRFVHAPAMPVADGRGDSTAESESDDRDDGRDAGGGQNLYYAVRAVDSDGARERTVVHRAGEDSVGDEYERGEITGFSFSSGDGGIQRVSRVESDRVAADRVECRGGDHVHGCGRDSAAAGSSGSRITITRISTGDGSLQPEGPRGLIGDDDRQQHAGNAAEQFPGRAGADHARDGRDAGTSDHGERCDDTDGDAAVDRDTGYDQLLHGRGIDVELRRGGHDESGAFAGPESDRRDGGDFGTIGKCAGPGERVRAESADALADRRDRETDSGMPPAPMFGLNLAGQGTIELVGIAFTTLTNTHTITAGTLTLFYWDELNSPSTVTLASATSATDTTITLNVGADRGGGRPDADRGRDRRGDGASERRDADGVSGGRTEARRRLTRRASGLRAGTQDGGDPVREGLLRNPGERKLYVFDVLAGRADRGGGVLRDQRDRQRPGESGVLRVA